VDPAVAFSGTLLLLIFGFRWPGIAQNEELQNPDESQLIASALTMADTGRYWGRIDGRDDRAAGPLPLAVPKLLGFRVDYVCAHAVQAFLLWGAVCASGGSSPTISASAPPRGSLCR